MGGRWHGREPAVGLGGRYEGLVVGFAMQPSLVLETLGQLVHAPCGGWRCVAGDKGRVYLRGCHDGLSTKLAMAWAAEHSHPSFKGTEHTHRIPFISTPSTQITNPAPELSVLRFGFVGFSRPQPWSYVFGVANVPSLHWLSLRPHWLIPPTKHIAIPGVSPLLP